ncbi:TerD family protein [Nocardia crassostreae]|uniref:TerD family protein n=1 Tax=Nocardia crassostreae TaxID=53428 RepID=UPI000829944B|nr:TerD family protein [Nocardia crassostreae]
MGVSLSKGGNVSLTKQAPNLTAVAVGLGWDLRTTTGTDFDLDASAIEHAGDNRTGEGEGDDEVINVDLANTPPTIDAIVFPVSIYEADSRGQSFGQVRNAYIRVVDRANGTELARYDLSEDASTETAMVFGELYRNGAEWKFRATGQGYASGLTGIARDFGVTI